MIIIRKQLQLIFLLSISFFPGLMLGMNILRPHDPLLWPFYTGNDMWQWFVVAETGIKKSKGFNEENDHTNVLKIWQPRQDAITMLEGFEPNSPIGQKIASLTPLQEDIINTFDLFSMSAELHLKASAAFETRYFFCKNWVLSAYIPFYDMSLDDVCFSKRDQSFTIEEIDEFKALVCELGGSQLNPWHRSGIGDVALFLDWFRDFPQNKPFLKNVRINWRVGVELPTGKRTDNSELFSIPFGRDGSFALPFGLNIELTLGSQLRACADVQLTHTFDNTRPRRIKTSVGQTELLLLACVPVHRDVGLTQRFELYVQWYRMIQGLSCKAGYQFYKQGEDIISLKTNTFSTEIANTAESLQDWTAHQYVFDLQYDFHVHMCPDSLVVPQLELFARIPFNGQRSALIPTFGGMISVDF